MAEAIAADNEGVGMVGKTIEGGTGEQIIGEDLAPFFESPVGSDDQRAVFIAFGDDLVEILDGLGRNGLEAEIVQNDQVVSQGTSKDAGVGAVVVVGKWAVFLCPLFHNLPRNSRVIV